MKYDNSHIRRQDRLLDNDRANRLLRNAEYGVLSICATDGTPYGIPLNYVWDENDNLYIHCAPEGRKLEIIRHNANASFCIVGRVNLLPQQFTTEYESIVLKGTIQLVDNDDERRSAIRLLIQKLSPEYVEKGMMYSEKSFHRVDILKLHINEYSGKSKHVIA
ncbi:MAG: pyridoxamine 5'-phosphate oxidase family protein [Prevotella sp.]